MSPVGPCQTPVHSGKMHSAPGARISDNPWTDTIDQFTRFSLELAFPDIAARIDGSADPKSLETPRPQRPRANGPIHGTGYAIQPIHEQTTANTPNPHRHHGQRTHRIDRAFNPPTRAVNVLGRCPRLVSDGPWALEAHLSPIGAHLVPGWKLAKGDGGVQCVGE